MGSHLIYDRVVACGKIAVNWKMILSLYRMKLSCLTTVYGKEKNAKSALITPLKVLVSLFSSYSNFMQHQILQKSLINVRREIRPFYQSSTHPPTPYTQSPKTSAENFKAHTQQHTLCIPITPQPVPHRTASHCTPQRRAWQPGCECTRGS